MHVCSPPESSPQSERAELQNKGGSRSCQFPPRWNRIKTSSWFCVAFLNMTTFRDWRESHLPWHFIFLFIYHKDKNKSEEIIMVKLSNGTLYYKVQELTYSQTHACVQGFSLLSLFLQIVPPQSGGWSWVQETRIQSPPLHLPPHCA